MSSGLSTCHVVSLLDLGNFEKVNRLWQHVWRGGEWFDFGADAIMIWIQWLHHTKIIPASEDK